MEECFRCGITSEETKLFDAISEEGIVKACKNCIDREGLPVVKKPSLDQLKESDERLSVREKLSMMSGIESKTDSRGNREYVKTSSGKNKQEFDLNDVIERNLEKRKLSQKSMEKLPPEKELVENFHWKVMRGRRLKKISQEQLGAEIGESETAINMIESRELPEDFERLIKKLEAYLRIRLFKNQKVRQEKNEAEISFDPYATKNTRVEDLKEKEGTSEEQREGSEESEESHEEYPEQNKTRRKKLWNLFRKRTGKDSQNEKKTEDSLSYPVDSQGYYSGDYSYQGYEEPNEKKQSKEDKEKDLQDSEEKKDRDKDELSQKDIDDLIFRKS